MDIMLDAHFWVGVAFAILVLILWVRPQGIFGATQGAERA